MNLKAEKASEWFSSGAWRLLSWRRCNWLRLMPRVWFSRSLKYVFGFASQISLFALITCYDRFTQIQSCSFSRKTGETTRELSSVTIFLIALPIVSALSPFPRERRSAAASLFFARSFSVLLFFLAICPSPSSSLPVVLLNYLLLPPLSVALPPRTLLWALVISKIRIFPWRWLEVCVSDWLLRCCDVMRLERKGPGKLDDARRASCCVSVKEYVFYSGDRVWLSYPRVFVLQSNFTDVAETAFLTSVSTLRQENVMEEKQIIKYRLHMSTSTKSKVFWGLNLADLLGHVQRDPSNSTEVMFWPFALSTLQPERKHPLLQARPHVLWRITACDGRTNSLRWRRATSGGAQSRRTIGRT